MVHYDKKQKLYTGFSIRPDAIAEGIPLLVGPGITIDPIAVKYRIRLIKPP
jgi:hypothetical protein